MVWNPYQSVEQGPYPHHGTFSPNTREYHIDLNGTQSDKVESSKRDGLPAALPDPAVPLRIESRDGRPKVSRRIVPELDDPRVAVERGLHNAALHAPASPVNEAHFAETRRGSGVHIVGDDRCDVARCEGVEIELGLDGNADVARHQQSHRGGR